MLDEPLPLTFVYLNRAAFLIWLAGGERSVEQNQQRVGDGDERRVSTLLRH
jgi:hypothetical protein